MTKRLMTSQILNRAPSLWRDDPAYCIRERVPLGCEALVCFFFTDTSLFMTAVRCPAAVRVPSTYAWPRTPAVPSQSRSADRREIR